MVVWVAGSRSWSAVYRSSWSRTKPPGIRGPTHRNRAVAVPNRFASGRCPTVGTSATGVKASNAMSPTGREDPPMTTTEGQAGRAADGPRVTIADVAGHAGVSPTTVSHVL